MIHRKNIGECTKPTQNEDADSRLNAYCDGPDAVVVCDGRFHLLTEDVYVVDKRRRVIQNLHDTVQVTSVSCIYTHSHTLHQ